MIRKMTGIIITDDNATFRKGLRTVLESMVEGLVIGEAADGSELQNAAKLHDTGLIFMDVRMPLMNGFEATRRVKRINPDIIVVAFTGYEDEITRRMMKESGADAVLLKSEDNTENLRQIMKHFRCKYSVNNNPNTLNTITMKTKKILLVDDDIDVVTAVETILRKEGYEVISASDKKEGMRMIREEKPDMAILDVMMTTHYEGFELAKEIMDDPELSKVPVLMQSSIEVLTTTKPDVQAMAREFRKNPGFKDLHVILIRDVNTGQAGVDYLAEDGSTIWFPVDGFLRKPVDPKKLPGEVKRIIG